jgi:hypothetical protein
MHAVVSPGSFVRGRQSGKALSGTRQGPSPCREGGDESLYPLRGGKLTREGISPSQEKVAY